MSFVSGLPTRRLSVASVPIAIVAAVAVRLTVPFDPAGATMLAITAFCIVMWIGNLIPPSYTGILCIGLIGVTFSADLALVGFGTQATWLVAFGLIMGEATRRSGLAGWASRWITDRATAGDPAANPYDTYRRLLVSLSAVGLGLALLIPATVARVLIFAPLLVEVGERFDSRTARMGLFLGPLFATYYGGVGVLTAALPNIIASGILDSVAGVTISWTEWATVMFPVMSLLRVGFVVAIAYWLYRPDPETLSIVGVDGGGPGDGGGGGGLGARAMTASDRRMLVYLLVGVTFWATDFLHGLHPVYGALLVVALAFLPSLGVVDFSEVTGDVDFSILFFLGAVFAIGEGMSRMGVANALAESLLGVIPTDAPLVVVLALVFVVVLPLMLLMGGLAVASVGTPILVSYGTAAGLPLVPIVMTEAIGLGTYFFPYQSAVLVAILAYDVIEAPELIRMTAWCSIATIFVLLPLQLAVFTLVF